MKNVVSAFMLTVILASTLVMAFDVRPVEASGTIYIRADGSVEPSWAPIARDGSTYAFTGNINDSIQVQRSNVIVDGNGYTLLGSGNLTGLLIGVNNVTVRNTTIRNFDIGIYALGPSFSTFSGNCLTANDYGILLDSSSDHNSVSGNNITANNYYGIWLYYSYDNSVSGNNITANNYSGIRLDYSSGNSVSGNNITNNLVGIWVESSSSYNSISENNVTNNDIGIGLGFSSDNRFYHNNFIDNTQQVDLYSSGYANVWDDGYPSGGNYWSNYNGTDVYRGSGQNINGPDGIGDIPNVLTSNNTDRYPLMGLFGSTTMIGENVTVFPADDVCVIFGSVIEEGLTIVEKPDVGPSPPPGVSILQYYVIVTTADYTGQITIKIIYNESMGMLANTTQEDLRLLQCVMLAGDVDEDFDVDIFDLVRLAGVYGVVKPDPRYDSNCDLDGDGDIDIFDLVRLAGNYGEVWQPETGWIDVTTWFDPETNSIFGVTQHLSIFGVTRS